MTLLDEGMRHACDEEVRAGFHWNLLASNGKVIATSEHYETRRAAPAGIASVQKNAPGASTFDADDQPVTEKNGQSQHAQGHGEDERLTVDGHTDAPHPPGTGVVRRSSDDVSYDPSRLGGWRRSHPGRHRTVGVGHEPAPSGPGCTRLDW
jgi:uncharacterized protein YegP (UPF0339 family)